MCCFVIFLITKTSVKLYEFKKKKCVVSSQLLLSELQTFYGSIIMNHIRSPFVFMYVYMYVCMYVCMYAREPTGKVQGEGEGQQGHQHRS